MSKLTKDMIDWVMTAEVTCVQDAILHFETEFDLPSIDVAERLYDEAYTECELITRVIQTALADIQNNDLDALVELLNLLPEKALKNYISEYWGGAKRDAL